MILNKEYHIEKKREMYWKYSGTTIEKETFYFLYIFLQDTTRLLFLSIHTLSL